MTDVSLSPDVVIIDGVPRVSSLEIAERFCKQHNNVLTSIRKICLECEEDFNERNFALVEYADAKGEMRPMYQLSRDGFTLLAMGFAGKKALEWKIMYIQAFNAMDEALKKKHEKQALKEAKKKALPKAVVAYDPVQEEINALLKKVDFYIREVDSIGQEVLSILAKEYKKKYPKPINLYDNPIQDFQIDTSCSLNSLFSSINFNLRSIQDVVAFKRRFLTI